MPTSIITTDDLREFKLELLVELTELLSKQLKTEPPKVWLRSSDVKKTLKISTTTLNNLRNKKVLKTYKIEGIYFYNAAEIDAVLLDNEVQFERYCP